MKIIFNGQEIALDQGVSVSEFLKSRDMDERMVTVEVNDKVLSVEQYADTIFKENDIVNVLFFMGGGAN